MIVTEILPVGTLDIYYSGPDTGCGAGGKWKLDCFLSALARIHRRGDLFTHRNLVVFISYKDWIRDRCDINISYHLCFSFKIKLVCANI